MGWRTPFSVMSSHEEIMVIVKPIIKQSEIHKSDENNL